MNPPDEHEANRQAWNEVTPVHNSHKKDQAAFFRTGGSTLFPEELELLGAVRGLSLLHLQCNCGQDSLSLAKLGACVTGVDISDAAIAMARQLSLESGIEAQFVRDDIFHFLASTPQTFERAIATYGFLPWLSDLAPWAAGIARVLAPAGRFVLVEFHPAALVFDEDWKACYPYSSHGRSVRQQGISDYVGQSAGALAPSGFEAGVEQFQGTCNCYEFFWGLDEVLGALLRAGLNLVRFEEYPYSNGARLFNDLKLGPGNRWLPGENSAQLPLMYGAVFEKKP